MVRQYLHPWVGCQCRQIKMPLLAARDHVGVNLEQHCAGGVALQRRLEHCVERLRVGTLQ